MSSYKIDKHDAGLLKAGSEKPFQSEDEAVLERAQKLEAAGLLMSEVGKKHRKWKTTPAGKEAYDRKLNPGKYR